MTFSYISVSFFELFSHLIIYPIYQKAHYYYTFPPRKKYSSICPSLKNFHVLDAIFQISYLAFWQNQYISKIAYFPSENIFTIFCPISPILHPNPLSNPPLVSINKFFHYTSSLTPCFRSLLSQIPLPSPLLSFLKLFNSNLGEVKSCFESRNLN